MRLWSLHPRYLDSKGLVALWREGLLAQKVLLGDTRGYRHHPQLDRFKNTRNPVGAIASYLRCVVDEADSRGYHFDRSRIVKQNLRNKIAVTSGQLEYELAHLMRKLKRRDPVSYKSLKSGPGVEPHPLFRKVKGNVEQWEGV